MPKSKLAHLLSLHGERKTIAKVIASRLSRAKIKCSICSSQFNTWDAQHRWALVLIVCLNRGRRFKACFARPRVVPVLQYFRVRPTPPTIGGFLFLTCVIRSIRGSSARSFTLSSLSLSLSAASSSSLLNERSSQEGMKTTTRLEQRPCKDELRPVPVQLILT